MQALETGPALYNWYFMRKWRSSLRKKRALFPQQHDFDDATLAPGHARPDPLAGASKHTEFGDVEDYFDGYAVAGGRLAGLQVPVSVLAAADDPIIPVARFARAAAAGAFARWRSPSTAATAVSSRARACDGFAERWVAEQLVAAVAASMAPSAPIPA